MTQEKNIDRAAKALLNADKPPKHKRLVPTKKDLERSFVMRVDRRGKSMMKEVE